MANARYCFYFAPHQDDELTNLGVPICRDLDAGNTVFCVLCTDGSASGARRLIGNGENCHLHEGIFESAAYGKGRLAGDVDRVSLVTNKTESGGMDWEPLMNYKDYLPDRYKNATEEQIHAGHGGGDFFIVEEFIEAVRKNAQPALDVYTACEWTAVGLLSALSLTNGNRRMELPRFRPAMPLEEKRVIL